MLRIKNVSYVNDYKLKILFNDGKTKVVDFENWINEGGLYILQLKNLLFFKKFQMDEFDYALCWPNGADFSPDALYEIGVEVKEQKKQTRPPTRRKRVSSSSVKSQAGISAKAK